MKGKNRISRIIGGVLILFLVFASLAGPARAQDSTFSIEIWLKADGSGNGVITAFLPTGGITIDQIVSNLEGVGALTGVSQKDLGGNHYEISFQWVSFEQAFSPDSWAATGNSVEATFDSLTANYQKITVHLPGTIAQSGAGTKPDDQTIVFSNGDTDAWVSFSTGSGSPSPSSSTPTETGAEQMTMELWVEKDGSGNAILSAYLPPGGHTIDELVSNLKSEPSLSDVQSKDLGGNNYEVRFTWTDYSQAIGGNWAVKGTTVTLDLGELLGTFAEATLHVPGVIQQTDGTKQDSSTVDFHTGDQSATTFTLSGTTPSSSTSPSPKPSPSSSASPKPSHSPSVSPSPTSSLSPQPSPTPSGSVSPQPTSSIPVPPSSPQASPSSGTPSTASSGGLPLWAIILIAVGGLGLIALLWVLLRRRPQPPAPPSHPLSSAAPPSKTPPSPGPSRFCSRCGARIEPTAPFCGSCGAPQGGPVPPPPPAVQETVRLATAKPVTQDVLTPPISPSTAVSTQEPPEAPETATLEAGPAEEEAAKSPGPVSEEPPSSPASPAACSGCGAPLPPGARFCMNCGKPIN